MVNKSKYFFVVLGLIIVFFSCKKEEKSNSFQINGRLEANVDSIYLYPGFISKTLLDTTLYDFNSGIDEGRFAFEGSAPYPQMLTLHSPKVGISTLFFIEKGRTDMTISFINGDKNVQISEHSKSNSQKEYEKLAVSKLNPISQNLGLSESKQEREKLSQEMDMAIIDHIKVNPNSYVALWLMIDRFCRSGSEYNEDYLIALRMFSDEIQNIPLYKNFKKKLVERKNFSFLDKSIPLKSLSGNRVLLDIQKSGKKYVLIDFWFSYCKPCLIEMPKYIPIYNRFKNYGFQIMSISVDNSSDVGNWKRVIREKNFNWLHFLDENGVESRKLDIIKFPTTFLVDKDGRILEKNISIEELEEFLNTNLE